MSTLPTDDQLAAMENGTTPDQFNTTVNSSVIGLELTAASEVQLRKVRFLDASGLIPLRSQTVLFGPPGLGKTTYSIGLAAAVTQGKMSGVDGPRNVLFSSQEDDVQGVLAPRAVAAGADLERLHFIKTLSLPSDIEKLKDAAKKLEAALIIIDPVAAHLDEKIDSHRDASTRKALAPIADLAEELNLAVLSVAHPNKATGANGLSRLSGSGAFGAAARSVMVFGADPGDPEGETGNRRIIGHLKCNVGRRAQSVTAEIEVVSIDTEDGPAEQTRLMMTGLSDLDADALLDSPSAEERTERDEAQDFLEEMLTRNPVRSREIKRAAEDAGLSWRTVERAKKSLGVTADKEQDGWYWSLPEGGNHG